MIWKITILEYLTMGGWVIIPLILLSLILLILVTERFLYLRMLQRDTITTDELINTLTDGTSSAEKVPKSTGIRGQPLDRFLNAKAQGYSMCY